MSADNETVAAPGGGTWWCADYADGTVWPCEVLRGGAAPWGVRVRPVAPAPDAGQVRTAPRRAVYDSAFNPTP